jgi:muconolactone D-isomerase
MEFLVQIESGEQPSGDQAFLDDLAARERRRGLELIEAGVIRSIWRVAGRQANVGIWEAEDATELHAAITSLPAFPWMDVRVTALARHPLNG